MIYFIFMKVGCIVMTENNNNEFMDLSRNDKQEVKKFLNDLSSFVLGLLKFTNEIINDLKYEISDDLKDE